MVLPVESSLIRLTRPLNVELRGEQFGLDPVLQTSADVCSVIFRAF